MQPNPPIPPNTPLTKLQLRLNPLQFQVFHSPKRFRILVAGRRFGKSELALAELTRAAETKSNQIIWYVAPTEKLAKHIIWRRLKQMTQHLWSRKPFEQELAIYLTNGSVIEVKGGFNPDSLRGRGIDLIVLDEAADLKADTWTYILRPALADRQGRALFLGTPKGRNHFYNYFELAQSTPNQWAAYKFTTAQGGIVKLEELESAGREMDPNTYRQEFEAEFTAIGQYRAYVSFTREANIRDTHFEPSKPLIWSLDFNVDPMCMLIMQRIDDIVYVLEEITVRSNSTTTEAACHVFAQRAAPYMKIVSRISGALEVHVYGDASGHQRRTASASTDWTIIRQFFATMHRGEIQISCRHTTFNPLVRDRINCVNSRLRNHFGDPQLFISPGCKELIRDLEEVCYTVDSTGSPTTELNKSHRDRTHMSDALGYYLSQAFSLKRTLNLPML